MSDVDLSGGSALLDACTHERDCVRYLCGPVADERCAPPTRAGRTDVEPSLDVHELAHVIFTAGGGVLTLRKDGVEAPIWLQWSLVAVKAAALIAASYSRI